MKAAITSVLVSLAFLFLLAGCFPGNRAPYKIDFYTLDYPPPVLRGAPLDQVVRMNRFSVAQVYNSTAMVYKPEEYKLAVYQYHKWRVNPGDLVTDYLARDFRSSGFFKAVFAGRQREGARFEVEGAVEEFLESREADGWKAVLALEVALLDRSEPSVDARVVFQRRYKAEEPLADQAPAAFARGMSACLARVSSEVIGGVAAAIAERSPGPSR